VVPENINIRIKFEKTGKLQFISHLDLCRAMKTAMIRAGIPIWYSEGFNPRPKMIFALPLSIGAVSKCEYMDIKITENMPLEVIREQLNNTTTGELNITEVYIPQNKFTEIAWAEYRIDFCSVNIQSSECMFEAPFIIMKRSKSGEKKETDILPLIKQHEITGDTITVLLSADSDSYLNPEYIASAVAARCCAPDYDITRLNLYKADGVTLFN
jgi:radical SAM-linked protein